MQAETTFTWLDISRVRPRVDQPRKSFDRARLEELAQSIVEHGVLQPILVRQHGEVYEIIAGERRYQASLLAGADRIPAMVQPLHDRETAMAALIENIQREDLNPIEEAEAMAKLLAEHGLTHEELAGRLGMSRSALTNRLRLLTLPDDVRQLIISRELSAGHAKLLAGLPDSATVRVWVKRIKKEQLSVAATEKLLAHQRQRKVECKPGKVTADVNLRFVEDSLREILGAKVRIRRGRNRGTVEIEFYSPDELMRIVDTIMIRQ